MIPGLIPTSNSDWTNPPAGLDSGPRLLISYKAKGLTSLKSSRLTLVPPEISVNPIPTSTLASRVNFVNILSWNAHSLNSNVKQLFIKNLPQDIICIQETWDNNRDCFNPLAGCTNSTLAQDHERGGGSLILLKKKP